MARHIAFALVFVLQAGVDAQPDPRAMITSLYTRTLADMQKATTAGEIDRIVDAIDAPDWVSINADGTRMTREEANSRRSTCSGSITPATRRLQWRGCSGNPRPPTPLESSGRGGHGTRSSSGPWCETRGFSRTPAGEGGCTKKSSRTEFLPSMASRPCFRLRDHSNEALRLR